MSSSRSRSTKPGSIRIIGGDWRRRRIEVPPGDDVRPTPDRVRETLFNWLGPGIAGTSCLDLFAGSGVLGFEALSRGAQRVVFVERDPVAVATLRRQQATLDAAADIRPIDAMRFLSDPGDEQFDIAFVDPPYAVAALPILQSLMPVLRAGARVYLERQAGEQWPEAEHYRWTRRSKAAGVEFGLAEFVP